MRSFISYVLLYNDDGSVVQAVGGIQGGTTNGSDAPLLVLYTK